MERQVLRAGGGKKKKRFVFLQYGTNGMFKNHHINNDFFNTEAAETKPAVIYLPTVESQCHCSSASVVKRLTLSLKSTCIVVIKGFKMEQSGTCVRIQDLLLTHKRFSEFQPRVDRKKAIPPKTHFFENTPHGCLRQTSTLASGRVTATNNEPAVLSLAFTTRTDVLCKLSGLFLCRSGIGTASFQLFPAYQCKQHFSFFFIFMKKLFYPELNLKNVRFQKSLKKKEKKKVPHWGVLSAHVDRLEVLVLLTFCKMTA